MFVFGIVLAILGALFGLPQMRERIHADLAQQGDIFLMLYFGIFVSTIIVGPIIDTFGNKIVLTVSAASVVAGLLGFSVAASFVLAMTSAFVLGFGGGGLNTAANAFPRTREPAGFSIFASLRAAKYPAVMLFAFLLLCQSGNESAIGGWTSTYVGSVGAPPRVATWILAAYWAGLMIGRVVGARVLARMRKERLVLISGIGSAIGTAVLIASPSLVTMTIGAVIVGLSFAAIYPTTLAIAADRYQRLAGTIFGLLFAVGLIGGMLFPWAIGHISEHYGVRAAMVLPLFGAIAIMGLVTAITRMSSRM